MRKIHLMKVLTAALLALMLLAGSLSALAEGTETAVVADLTETASEEPVLLASVNGDEVWSNNEALNQLVDYYLQYYASYGYNTSDPSMMTYLQGVGLEWAIEASLYDQKAKELGISGMTEEQKADLEKQAREEWENAVDYYASAVGGATETSTEEEKAQAREAALSYIEKNLGFTEEAYVTDFVQGSEESQRNENVRRAVLGEFEVSEDEVTNYFNELVEEDRTTYEGNVPMYEYYTNYMGSNSYYVPEGYRGITHILLEVDSELMNNYTSLLAKMEEQQQAEEATAEETAETEETAAPAEESTVPAEETAAPAEETAAPAEETAAPEGEPAETAEPEEKVTQEMIDTARQAILDSVQAKVDEIMAKYEAGTPFADLVADYGTDPGMKEEPNKTNGYAVHPESILWDPAFTEGAMALEKIGDVSKPVLGSYGVHILHYTRDVPAGAVELTEELRTQLKEELLSEKENAAVTEMLEGWKAAAEIIYTDEGQAILDALKEEQSETVETTEATEETLAGD